VKERKQGPEESTIEFIYDILDLCRKVDPNMSEAAKLSHMWRGLKPSLTEKLWSLKPASCDEFLREVRRYQEMTSRARQEDWAMREVDATGEGGQTGAASENDGRINRGDRAEAGRTTSATGMEPRKHPTTPWVE
jgi:hypothetical protein